MTRLSEYLSEHGIRQIDFAKTIGTTQPMVSKLARGAALPTLDMAYRIQKATCGAVSLESWVEAGEAVGAPSPSPGAAA